MLSYAQKGAIAACIAVVVMVGWYDRSSWQLLHKGEHQQTHADKTASKAAKMFSTEDANDRIARYTFWLAILTGCLVGATSIQGYFLLRADRTNRIIANAAKETSEAAAAIEYPIIGSSYMGPELESTDGLVRPNAPYGSSSVDEWPTRYSVISSIEFRNYGRTPAFVNHIEMGTFVGLCLPEIPPLGIHIPCAPGTVIEEKSYKEIETHFGFELSEDQIRQITERVAILWFYIALVYRDVRNTRHEARFCWKWSRENPTADALSYFFDDGSAPAAYTRKT